MSGVPEPRAHDRSPPASSDPVEAHDPAFVRAADFRRALSSLPFGVVIVDADGVVRYANPAAENVLTWDDATLVGHPLGLPLGDHDSRGQIEVRQAGGGYRVVSFQTRDVEWQGADASLVTVDDVTADATERRGLVAREERYALAIDGARDGLWDWDLVSGTLHLSARWRALVGLGNVPDDDHDPGIWLDRTHPDDLTRFLDALEAHLSGGAPMFTVEHRVRRPDASYVWMLARGRAVFGDDGSAVRIAGSLTDISDRKALEERLRHEARHDTLTGLANRRLLLEFLETALARAERSRETLAVALLDLDGFKAVNDTHGHDVGDQLLVETADRLIGQIRPSDLAARLGGDEFALVLTELESEEVAATVCRRIDARLREPHSVGDVTLRAAGSIGYVTVEAGRHDSSTLLRLADQAMYLAKRDGGGPQGLRTG